MILNQPEILNYVLLRKRKYNEIVALWDAYIKRNPDDARAYLEREGTYYWKNDSKKAMQDAKKACELGNPEGCKRYKEWQKKLSKS